MLLRRFIGCITLCMVFVLSSTYAQAVRHIDDWQATSQVRVEAKLPPCHQGVTDAASDDNSSDHHDGCCSSFACCLGVAVEYIMRSSIRSSPLHDLGDGSVMRSALPKPLSPPPKTI